MGEIKGSTTCRGTKEHKRCGKKTEVGEGGQKCARDVCGKRWGGGWGLKCPCNGLTSRTIDKVYSYLLYRLVKTLLCIAWTIITILKYPECGIFIHTLG